MINITQGVLFDEVNQAKINTSAALCGFSTKKYLFCIKYAPKYRKNNQKLFFSYEGDYMKF